MSRSATLFVVFVTLGLMAAGCGAGDADPLGESDSEAVSVTSADGVVTVAVPDDAAPAGTDVTVAAGDASTLPSDLVASGLPVFVYDLGPDGAQFDQPVTVTFRIPAADVGFDPDEGMPLAVLASRSGDGLLEVYPSVQVSLDRGDLVVSGATDHFSEAIVVVSGVPLSLATLPSPVKVGVGQTFHAIVSNIKDYERAIGTTYDGQQLFYRATQPVTYVQKIDGIVGEFRCDAETEGVLPRAITAEIRMLTSGQDEDIIESFQDGSSLFQFVYLVDVFGIKTGTEVVATFHADVECTAFEDAPPPETTSSTEPPGEPGEDKAGDQTNDESETVGEGEGEPGADITKVRHAVGENGEQCFFVEVVGDGEKTATAPGWYDIIIKSVGPDGDEWSANVAYFGAEVTDRGVRLGPSAPGQTKVDGATVSAEWIDGVLKVTVDGGETDLAVETFQLTIGVSNPDSGTFWDTAMGIGQAAAG